MAVSFAERLSRCRDGDRVSLNDLFDRWRPLLRLQARRLLGPDLAARIDPSDVVQESFAQAYADLPDFRGHSEAQWIAWLRRIVAGQAAKARRHHRAERRSPQREEPPDSGAAAAGRSPSSAVLNEEEAARLAAVVERLPTMMREVVQRRVFDGEPFDEIAAALGCSTGAARVTWTRALRRLRQILD
jgi:RNA polymerase sigma-70 factor (ECF subfamily)